MSRLSSQHRFESAGPKGGEPKQPDDEGGLALDEKVRTDKPRMFKVIMHNDHYTTQDFVVAVLERHFRKSPTEAMSLMLYVHTKGRAVVAIYPRDVAETKVRVVTDEARAKGHPLLLTVEPE